MSVRPAPAHLTAPVAAALTFSAAGLVNGVGWLSAPGSTRAEAALFDLTHFVVPGLLAALLVALGEQLLERLPLTSPRMRRAATTLALYVPCALLGALLLPVDLTNFSQRQSALPPALALTAGVLLFSGVPVLGVAIGRRLRTRLGRAVASAAIVAAGAINALTLPNDYFVIHLVLTAGAVGVASAAWTEAPLRGRLASVRPRFVLLALAPLALFGASVRPSARAASLLATSTASVMSPWIAASQARLLPRRGPSLEDGMTTNPWFVDRSQAPAVPPSEPPLFTDPPLVILITVDALRADVVASGKHDRRLPTLAALRDRAVWFSSARATGTLTKLSISGLMLSSYFSQQYWVEKDNYHTIAEDETRRFPELLREAGVRTINFRSIGWLRNGNVLGGFDEDVHVFTDGAKHRYTPSAPVFAQLLPRVKKLGQQAAFVYSHLSDPHAPYDLGTKKGSQFSRYLSEVALVDAQLGRLVRLLDDTGLAARTLLIISADHGEAFGEHDSRTHGTTLYDETLRVPLLFVLPQATPRRVDDLVSLVDLGPTILDVFGLPTPGTMMGQSLVPYLRGEDPVLERPILAETRLMQAWITPERKKLIVDTRTGRHELYDLERDPDELDNLADDAEAVARPLAELERFIDVHRLRRPGYRPPLVR